MDVSKPFFCRRLRCPSLYHILKETVEEFKASDLAWFEDALDSTITPALPTLGTPRTAMSSPPHRSPRSSMQSTIHSEGSSPRLMASSNMSVQSTPPPQRHSQYEPPPTREADRAVPLVPQRSSRGNEAFNYGEMTTPRSLAAAQLAMTSTLYSPSAGNVPSTPAGTPSNAGLSPTRARRSSRGGAGADEVVEKQSPRALAMAQLAAEEKVGGRDWSIAIFTHTLPIPVVWGRALSPPTLSASLWFACLSRHRTTI